MAGRMVNLDKSHGVISVVIGEVFQSLLAKLIMRTGGAQEKYSFRSVNVSAGFEAGIEGGIYSVHEREKLYKGEAGEEQREHIRQDEEGKEGSRGEGIFI